jgi:hypothetical protein
LQQTKWQTATRIPLGHAKGKISSVVRLPQIAFDFFHL